MNHTWTARVAWALVVLLMLPVTAAWGQAGTAPANGGQANQTGATVPPTGPDQTANTPATGTASAIPVPATDSTTPAATAEKPTTPAGAEKKPAPSNLTGFFGFGSEYSIVTGDRGRFREDMFAPVGLSGGITDFQVRTRHPDPETGLEVDANGRLIANYDYRFNLLLKKKNEFYLSINASSRRRWFDGSTQFWSPELYHLSEDFADGEHRLYEDISNLGIEFGLTPKNGPQVVVGYRRYQRHGFEEMEFGGLAQQKVAPTQPNFNGIPASTSVDGITNTFYLDISQTFLDKYNFRLYQEWEHYGDNRLIVLPGYLNGAIDPSNYNVYPNQPQYTSYTSIASFDSFLTDNTYVATSYMYEHLKNNSVTSYQQPLRAAPLNNQLTDVAGNNLVDTNAVASGFRQFGLFGQKDLELSAGTTVEHIGTDSSNYGLLLGGPASQRFFSATDEVQVEESFRLAYRGFEQTALIFDAQLAQDDADTQWSGDDGNRIAALNYYDQNYSLKAVHRFNQAIKTTASWNIYDHSHTDDAILRNSATGYPDWLGDWKRSGQNIRLQTDFRLNQITTATLLYQYGKENISTDLASTDTEKLNTDRYSASLATSPLPNLSLVGTFSLEGYHLITPTGLGDPAGTNHALGQEHYRYTADDFTVSLDAQYAFNPQTMVYLRFQHTGTSNSFINDYGQAGALDRVGVGIKRKLSKNETVMVGYQYDHNNNYNFGSFDDYNGNTILARYEISF